MRENVLYRNKWLYSNEYNEKNMQELCMMSFDFNLDWKVLQYPGLLVLQGGKVTCSIPEEALKTSLVITTVWSLEKGLRDTLRSGNLLPVLDGQHQYVSLVTIY